MTIVKSENKIDFKAILFKTHNLNAVKLPVKHVGNVMQDKTGLDHPTNIK